MLLILSAVVIAFELFVAIGPFREVGVPRAVNSTLVCVWGSGAPLALSAFVPAAFVDRPVAAAMSVCLESDEIFGSSSEKVLSVSKESLLGGSLLFLSLNAFLDGAFEVVDVCVGIEAAAPISAVFPKVFWTPIWEVEAVVPVFATLPAVFWTSIWETETPFLSSNIPDDVPKSVVYADKDYSKWQNLEILLIFLGMCYLVYSLQAAAGAVQLKQKVAAWIRVAESSQAAYIVEARKRAELTTQALGASVLCGLLETQVANLVQELAAKDRQLAVSASYMRELNACRLALETTADAQHQELVSVKAKWESTTVELRGAVQALRDARATQLAERKTGATKVEALLAVVSQQETSQVSMCSAFHRELLLSEQAVAAAGAANLVYVCENEAKLGELAAVKQELAAVSAAKVLADKEGQQQKQELASVKAKWESTTVELRGAVQALRDARATQLAERKTGATKVEALLAVVSQQETSQVSMCSAFHRELLLSEQAVAAAGAANLVHLCENAAKLGELAAVKQELVAVSAAKVLADKAGEQQKLQMQEMAAAQDLAEFWGNTALAAVREQLAMVSGKWESTATALDAAVRELSRYRRARVADREAAATRTAALLVVVQQRFAIGDPTKGKYTHAMTAEEKVSFNADKKRNKIAKATAKKQMAMAQTQLNVAGQKIRAYAALDEYRQLMKAAV
ncbi:hypothetical protein BDR26DRAFT_935532 [Obelidium mucronatum]|nr:hypothetical protein BDR26DRAFT_935532 [Obelidium mucronatum]